jgi:TonB-linked SusC/RagA family outer membrane protein
MQNAFRVRYYPAITQLLRVMRLTAFFLLALCVHLSARTLSQTITFSGTQVPVRQVLEAIRQQTHLAVAYNPDVLALSHPVTLSAQGQPVAEFLEELCRNQPFTYVIQNKTIFISEKSRPGRTPSYLPAAAAPRGPIRGKVVDSLGNPLAGASVVVRGSRTGVQSGSDGAFVLETEEDAVLVITFSGYEPVTTTARKLRAPSAGPVVLRRKSSPLDDVQVIAYGTTTRRLATGSITKVSAEEIGRQPVSNPLAALEGRVPGMKIQQADGLPGGYFDIVIRGQNSLVQQYRPLILLDGIPIANESMSSLFPGANAYNSPLSVLNPGDIESIDVLKDADATAIYGSRGSNGVILITSKKGKAGKGSLDINAYTGITTSTVQTRLLNTAQYLQMRHEAFANDGILPTKTNAPDLLAWDTTRYTDWNRLLQQGHATSNNVQLSYTAGSAATQMRLAMGYHHETPLYAGTGRLIGKTFGYDKGNTQLTVTHRSADNKLNLSMTAGYSLDQSRYGGLTTGSVLAPDAPYPLDSDHQLVWSEGGVSYDNPFASLYNDYGGTNKALLANLSLSYQLFKGLQARVSAGYNTITLTEVVKFPQIAQDPADTRISSARMRDNTVSTAMVEPMLQFNHSVGRGQLEVLVGQTWQAKTGNNRETVAKDYSSDVFVGTTSGASTVTANATMSKYYYEGTFAKINYNLKNKWIVNLTGRRDGSSRFGPGRRFSNFGAGGVAYLFSEELFIKRALPFLSFGKLRGTYGVTGNDNIGDYQYYENWAGQNGYSYDGHAGLTVYGLFNPDYSWEKNVKAEAAIDLGFLHDRLLVGVNYYRSSAGNQLINYLLPSQTGNTSVLRNFPAVIQNSGLETTVSAVLIRHHQFRWEVSANATIARNKLVSFPGLDVSTYANKFVIGESVSISKYLPFNGVDPVTGLYTYRGTATKDRTVIRDLSAPTVYGGISNSFSFRGFSLDLFAQYVKQERQSFISRLTHAPGTMYNQPVEVLDRWQQAGDRTTFQKYSTTGAANTAFSRLKQSDAYIVDASFLRLTNASLTYALSPRLLKPSGLKGLRVYLQGQNLLLLTPYKQADPESAGFGNPLLKIFTGGIQVTL